MLQRFSERLEPWRLVDAEEVIEGVIPLDSLPRLAPLLVPGKKEVAFVLRFGRDSKRRGVISSEVRAELTLICQRCLQPMPLKLKLSSRLALVEGFTEAEQLPADLDPLLLDEDGLIDLRNHIEEELLLAIPVAPRHDEACALHVEEKSPLPEMESQRPERESPFAVLAELSSSKQDN